MIRFSIVIPAYNYGHVLERAVVSACTQSGDDFEVIVIDDGSTDNTPEVLTELQKSYPELRVIRQENAGLAAVRNRGIDESQGEFLLFLDADDELLPEALPRFRQAAAENPAADLLIAPTESVFPDGRRTVGEVPSVPVDAEQRFLDYLYKRLRMANGAVAMGRKVFALIAYNPRLRQTEDIPVFAHCLANFSCHAVAGPTTRIYKHEGSMRHDVDTALKLGEELVDEIFDPERLPHTFMRHRRRYLARRYLSLFRLCYRAKRYREAKQFFRKAFTASWRDSLRRPGYVLKYLKALLAYDG